METSESGSGKRKRIKQKEKVKIHYRQRVKLKHRPSRWVRFKKYVSKNRKMITVVSILSIGLLILMTSVFLTIKQKSDRHKELMEQKFIPPIGN